ncbi:unnamed protein product, partial [Vitis vinifera]|uniref:Uncharacterized protein n=1 Tax=Vitis vinifera TaxID=29760 RepID=D7T0R7_VITVI
MTHRLGIFDHFQFYHQIFNFSFHHPPISVSYDHLFINSKLDFWEKWHRINIKNISTADSMILSSGIWFKGFFLAF